MNPGEENLKWGYTKNKTPRNRLHIEVLKYGSDICPV